MRTVRSPAVSSSSPMPVRWTSRMRRRISATPNPPAIAPPGLSAGLPSRFRSAAAADLPAERRTRGAALRRSVLATVELLHESAQRQAVAGRAKALHHGEADAGPERDVTEGFAAMRIGHVHLDHREPRGQYGVPESDAGVGETTGVQEHPIERSARPVQRLDEHALVLALPALDLASKFGGEGVEVAV